MLITSSSKNVEQMISNLQGKMNRIHRWCVSNKLLLNVNVEPIGKISISGTTLDKLSHYEYLGMIVENKLNLDKQIESMYKKANKKLGILSRIRMFITTHTASRIYKTMIRPLIEYVDFIIDSGSKSLISKLDRLQERALMKIEYC